MGRVGGHDLARRENVQDLSRAEDRRQGQAGRHTLADANQIRLHAVVFEGEPLPCPSKASLNFVEDKQRVMLFGPTSQRLDVGDRQGKPRPALNAFNKYPRNLFRRYSGSGQILHAALKELLPIGRVARSLAGGDARKGQVVDERARLRQPRLGGAGSRELMSAQCPAVVVARERENVVLSALRRIPQIRAKRSAASIASDPTVQK